MVGKYSPERWAEWININSFVSRMFLDNLTTEPMFAFSALRDTLERRLETKNSMFECEIIAAAQWMETCASRLLDIFHRGSTGLTPLDCRVISSFLPQFRDSKVLSMERWQYWTDKFSELAARENLSGDAKTHARLAAGAIQTAARRAERAMQTAGPEMDDGQNNPVRDPD
jgi:hypothetical protein